MRHFALLLALLLALLASACSSKPVEYTVGYNNHNFKVSFTSDDMSEGIMTDTSGGELIGTHSFVYRPRELLEVVYPNGYVYRRSYDASGFPVSESWPYEESAEELGYLSTDHIGSVVRMAQNLRGNIQAQRQTVILRSLLLFALAAWFLLKPRSIWWLSGGWKYKDVEPSEAAIAVFRLIGGIIAFVAILSSFARQ